MSAVSHANALYPYSLSVTFIRVLLLRRKASPTETELHILYSNMVDEALEMAAVQRNPADTMDSSIPSLRTDPQAVP